MHANTGGGGRYYAIDNDGSLDGPTCAHALEHSTSALVTSIVYKDDDGKQLAAHVVADRSSH